MDDFFDLFENLKISAFSKVQKINCYVTNTTIGPHSTFVDNDNVEESRLHSNKSNERDSTCATQVKYNNKANTKVKSKVVATAKFKNHLDTATSINDNDKRAALKQVQPSQSTVYFNDLRDIIERKRLGKLNDAIQQRIEQITNFSTEQQRERIHFIQNQHEIMRHELLEQERLINQTVQESDNDAMVNQMRLIEHYQQAADRIKRHNQQLREQEKARQQIHEILDLIKSNQAEFRVIYQEVIMLVKWCKTQNKLTQEIGGVIRQMKGLPDAMEEVIANCKPGKITSNEGQRTTQLVNELRGIRDAVKKMVADVVAEEDRAKDLEQQNQEQIKQQQQQQQQLQRLQQQQLRSQHLEPIKELSATSSAGNALQITTSLRAATELQNFLEEHIASCQAIITLPALKQYRFDCKKAINIPVNALSAVNPRHLVDKYEKLSSVLVGRAVLVGDRSFNSLQHPQGVPFCTELLAKKFVLQGDLMISSNPEAAFYYATIIVSLWSENETFGKLLLAHFHKECPYLIPFYPAKLQEQTNEEYYLSRGYRYEDGVVEAQDKFLKRMTGIMRLYAAILIAKTKSGLKGNPHGVSHAWRWIAAFLNLPPNADITATLLDVFLEVTGATLQTVYGKMFNKLMRFICGTYFPILKKIDAGGPVSRLEVTLQDYQRMGRFTPPKGTLPVNFW